MLMRRLAQVRMEKTERRSKCWHISETGLPTVKVKVEYARYDTQHYAIA